MVGCQHADDVLIDAPWEINADMIKSLGINLVVAGTTHDESSTVSKEPSYKVAKEMGIFKEIPSESTLTVSQVVSRILDKEAQYREKYEKKTAAEDLGDSGSEDLTRLHTCGASTRGTPQADIIQTSEASTG